jgi:glycosyltransferase involved in cell wall biosynthesis
MSGTGKPARSRYRLAPKNEENGIRYLDTAREWVFHSRAVSPQGEWPKISIVMPSYNQKNFIESALRSVLSQRYPNMEIIVIDPGSTDGTREIIEQYRAEVSRIIFEPDNGQSQALQKGLNLAAGDILTWLCTDDLLEPNALFQVAGAFKNDMADIVAGGCRRVDETGATLDIHHCSLPFNLPHRLCAEDLLDFFGSFNKGNYFFQPEFFFRRSIWERCGAFLWERAFYAMDYDLWIRMALAGANVLHIVPVLASSRIHETQKTRLDSQHPPYYFQISNFMRFYMNEFDRMLATYDP